MTQPVTGTYTVLRGSGTDSFGDETDTATPVSGYSGIPGSMVEQERTTRRNVDSFPRDVRRYAGRLPGWMTILPDDRIKEDRTNLIYQVYSARKVPNPFGESYNVIRAILVS